MIRPLNERVVIKPTPYHTMRGSLHIPEVYIEKAARNQDGVLTEGTILAVGPGELTKKGRRIAIELKAGDRVVYPLCVATEYDDDGATVHVLHQCHVYGTLPSEALVEGVKNWREEPRPDDVKDISRMKGQEVPA